MTQQSIKANRYVLHDGHLLEVTYEETAFDGQPRLNYHVLQGPATRTFSGNQISSKESDIGTLVTVTLEAIEDGDATLFTLLIPTINLTGTPEQPFETLAIYTTARSSIEGPNLVQGAVQRYQVVKLQGTAQFVIP